MDNQVVERERVISIVDLLYFILKEWRKLILAGAIGMIVLLLLFVYKNRSVIFNKAKNVEAGSMSEEEYNQRIAGFNNTINGFKLRIANYEKYKEESILMKLDAYNVPQLTVDYFVDLNEGLNSVYNNKLFGLVGNIGSVDDTSEDENDGDNLGTEIDMNAENSPTYEMSAMSMYDRMISEVINRYKRYFSTKLDWNGIIALTGVNKQYLREVIKISSSVANRRFTISISYNDEAMLQKIFEIIDKDISSFTDSISQDVYKHSITKTEYPMTYVKDSSILKSQNDMENMITGCLNNIDTNTTKLNKFIKEYKNSVASSTISKKSLIKYMIIGIFVGCFIIACVYFCIYIFGGYLHIDDEIKSLYGIEIYSVIVNKNTNKKALHIIDDFISKLMKKHCYNDTLDEGALRTSVFLKNNNDANLAVIGTGNVDKVNEFIGKLQSCLSDKKIINIGNIVKSASAVNEFTKYDSILLVEELEVSKFADIDLEYNIASSLGKKIEGYIIVT